MPTSGGDPTRTRSLAVPEDALAGRAEARSWKRLEERGCFDTHRWHDQRSIQVVIPHLARGLGHEDATVTCRAMKPTRFEACARRMLCADGIIGAQCRGPE